MIVSIVYAIIFMLMVNSQNVCCNIRTDFTYTLDKDYPIGEKLFGNIAGVDVDKDNNVIIFHRGSHRWNRSTFSLNDVYLLDRLSPIPEETVVVIDPKKKTVIRAWGSNTFFMPHGLSLDRSGENVWLTDVAMHQIFKYPIDGSKELMSLGTPFVPGNDDVHFCKPTSVADTGEFIFVADGYCNSRIVMFSDEGKFYGEFGQSPEGAYLSGPASAQPTFNIPHKLTYSPEAKMLCVADRENGRIQCFSFEPRRDKTSDSDSAMLLNGAIKWKFTIADPLFNGLLFSLDYSPIQGGILVAVSGQNPLDKSKPALGFVYNVTTGQLISKFNPPPGQTFGMAHDLAISGDEADSLYVVDISPVNLWKFSRPVRSRLLAVESFAGQGINRALSMIETKDHKFSRLVWYILLFTTVGAFVLVITKTKQFNKYHTPISFSSLYSNGVHNRRANLGHQTLLNTILSRRTFFNMFDRGRHQRQNDFSRIPLEESDNSDDDKSDSDVEEFNISQLNIKINV